MERYRRSSASSLKGNFSFIKGGEIYVKIVFIKGLVGLSFDLGISQPRRVTCIRGVKYMYTDNEPLIYSGVNLYRLSSSHLQKEKLYILNQKRNFRKIGLRGGHTRYERKKKSTPTSNETEISNEINDFQTVHEL